MDVTPLDVTHAFGVPIDEVTKILLPDGHWYRVNELRYIRWANPPMAPPGYAWHACIGNTRLAGRLDSLLAVSDEELEDS